MNSTPYSTTKVPPAPVLYVQLSAPSELYRSAAFPALVDTGGDFTTAPLDWLLEIDAPETRWAYLRGFWSTQRAVTLYLVDLHFVSQNPGDAYTADQVLPDIEIVGIPNADIEAEIDREIVLGRNALNQLTLLLDGPQQQCDVLERRPLRF